MTRIEEEINNVDNIVHSHMNTAQLRMKFIFEKEIDRFSSYLSVHLANRPNKIYIEALLKYLQAQTGGTQWRFSRKYNRWPKMVLSDCQTLYAALLAYKKNEFEKVVMFLDEISMIQKEI